MKENPLISLQNGKAEMRITALFFINPSKYNKYMEIIKQDEIVAPVPVKDIELTAMLPSEMVDSQKQLISWCERKIIAEGLQVEELRQAVEHAKKMKWKVGPLKGQYERAVKRVSYYEKIKGALEQGYYIVPNFPIEVFAVRTKKADPSKKYSTTWWGSKEQSAQELPEGSGEYQNPFPLVTREQKTGSDGKKYSKSYAEGWDELEFPVTMAKPEIMEASSNAMRKKIFDRIGVMPPVRRRRRNEDPVIVGQIFHKEGPQRERIVSFMIAWHLNTNVL